jgi:hypothetical protein
LVDAVDPDVLERAAAEVAVEARVVARVHLHCEVGAEESQVTELARTRITAALARARGARQRERLERRALEMQSIGDHQLHAVLTRRRDHVLALRDGSRHRLLAEHVDARAGRAHGVRFVHRIRQCDVGRIHLAAPIELVEVAVIAAQLRAVAVSERRELLRVVRDERYELAVAIRMPK